MKNLSVVKVIVQNKMSLATMAYVDPCSINQKKMSFLFRKNKENNEKENDDNKNKKNDDNENIEKGNDNNENIEKENISEEDMMEIINKFKPNSIHSTFQCVCVRK